MDTPTGLQQTGQLFTCEEDNQRSFSHLLLLLEQTLEQSRDCIPGQCTAVSHQASTASVYIMHSQWCLFHSECACVMTFSACALKDKVYLALRKVRASANQAESREQLLNCQVFHRQTCVYTHTQCTLEVNLPLEQHEIGKLPSKIDSHFTITCFS